MLPEPAVNLLGTYRLDIQSTTDKIDTRTAGQRNQCSSILQSDVFPLSLSSLPRPSCSRSRSPTRAQLRPANHSTQRPSSATTQARALQITLFRVQAQHRHRTPVCSPSQTNASIRKGKTCNRGREMWRRKRGRRHSLSSGSQCMNRQTPRPRRSIVSRRVSYEVMGCASSLTTYAMLCREKVSD